MDQWSLWVTLMLMLPTSSALAIVAIFSQTTSAEEYFDDQVDTATDDFGVEEVGLFGQTFKQI